jgi:hypothetical protein
MNERIKELATAAKLEHCVSHVRLQDFAERIIKECANIVDNVEPGYNDYRSQIEVMMRNDCVKVLLDKFDIEDNRSETRKITGDGE